MGSQSCQSGDQLQDVHLWREFFLAFLFASAARSDLTWECSGNVLRRWVL